MFDPKYDMRKILELTRIKSSSNEINSILNNMSEALQALYTKKYPQAALLFEQQATQVKSLTNQDKTSQYILCCCYLFKWISDRFRFEKELAVIDELKQLLKENDVNLYYIINQFEQDDLKQNDLTLNIQKYISTVNIDVFGSENSNLQERYAGETITQKLPATHKRKKPTITTQDEESIFTQRKKQKIAPTRKTTLFTQNPQIPQNQTIRSFPKQPEIPTRNETLLYPTASIQNNFFGSGTHCQNTSPAFRPALSKSQIDDYTKLIKSFNPPADINNSVNYIFSLIKKNQLSIASLQLQNLMNLLSLYRSTTRSLVLNTIDTILKMVNKSLTSALQNNLQQYNTTITCPNHTNTTIPSTNTIKSSEILTMLCHQGLPAKMFTNVETVLNCIDKNEFEAAKDTLDGVIYLISTDDSLNEKKRNLFRDYFIVMQQELAPVIKIQKEKALINATPVNTNTFFTPHNLQTIYDRNIIISKSGFVTIRDKCTVGAG